MNRREVDAMIARMDGRRPTPKLCIHCKHYAPEKFSDKGGLLETAKCLNPLNASMVDGKPREAPEQLRHGMYSNACKPMGLWWEPK